MNNKTYLKKLVSKELNKIKQNRYVSGLIKEEYSKILESGAGDIRSTLNKLHYVERGNELDSGGDIPNYAAVLFTKYFKHLAKEYPDVRIEVTAGNDDYEHHQDGSRHKYGEAIDFIVTHGELDDVRESLKSFKSKTADFKYLDEYKSKSKKATGHHFHIAYVGSQSQYNKSKTSGKTESNLNQWGGEAEDGTNLAELDSLLASFAKLGKPGQVKMLTLDGSVNREFEGQKTHYWQFQIPVLAPDIEKFNTKKLTQTVNDDGIVQGKPETIKFYPNGLATIYNDHAAGGMDVEVETRREWWKRFNQVAKVASYMSFPSLYAKGMSAVANKLGYDNKITKALNNDNWIDRMASMTNPKVVTIYNRTGDIMGTVIPDKKYGLVFDIGSSPQFAYDDDGNPTDTGTTVMNAFQLVLDVAGIIPLWGDIIDIVNAVIYYIRGKYFEAALSIIAVIPVVGSFVKFGVKGSVKVGNMATKLFLKKISFGLMFKSASKQGIKNAEDLILGLQKMNVIDASDIAWLARSGVTATVYKLIMKTESAFKKFLPRDAYKSSEQAIKAVKTFVDNFDNALKSLNIGSKSAQKINKVTPDAAKLHSQTKFGKWLRNSDGKLSWAAKMIKGVPAIFTITLNKLKNILLRLPQSRVDMIVKYIDQTTIKLFQNNPQKLKILLHTMDPKVVYKILDPDSQGMKTFIDMYGNQVKKSVDKFTTKELDSLIKEFGTDKKISTLVNTAKADGNVFLKGLMESPAMYIVSQQQAFKAGNLLDYFQGALGVKMFDQYYNEFAKITEEEFGYDIGPYGKENQSIVYFLFYKAAQGIAFLTDMRDPIELRKQRRNYYWNQAQNGTAQEKEPGIALNALKSILDYLMAVGGFEEYSKTHDQIFVPIWNEIPGDDNNARLLWIKKNSDPNTYKKIEHIISGKLSNELLDKGNEND